MSLLFPKPARQVSHQYLDWIRGLDCVIRMDCYGRIDPNHLRHVGAGGADYGAIPMCRKHHGQFHDMPLYAFEAKYQINLWRECALLLMQWIEEKEKLHDASSDPRI